MDELQFVVDPNLIAIATFIVPFLTELFTHLNATSKVKQHVATVLVLLVLAGSLVLEIVIRGTIDIDGTDDVLRLVVLMLAQFGLVRAAVEGGHRGLDAIETQTGHVDNVLAPNFGVGKESQAGVDRAA